MKRFKILIASLALPLLSWAADAKSVPYSTDFSDISDWTIINVQAGSQTWQLNTTSSNYSGTGATQGLYYRWDRDNPGDDWAISPAIHLEAGKEYKIKIWHKPSSTSGKESYKMMMASGSSIEELNAGTELFKYEDYNTPTWKHEVKVVTVQTTGDYHFGIYCFSTQNQYNVLMTNFYIGENVVTPAAPSGFTAVADADHALKADLSWTLPTTDDDGAALTEALTGVEVYRDGALIKTLDGTANSFTDDETTGLTSGFHKYKVRVLMGDTKGAFTSEVETKYVGPIAAATLPWTSDFSSQDKFDTFWTVIKGENSGSTTGWKYYSSTYGNAAQYFAGTNKREDDWLISQPLTFAKAGAYKVTVNAKYSSTKTNFEVWLGTGYTVADFTQKVGVIENMSYYATDYSFIVFVDQPGEYHLGLHANAAASSYSTYYVYTTKVEEYPIKPVQIADLTATINGDQIDLAWTNPTKTNADTELTALTKVEIFRGTTLVATIDNPAPGSAGAWSDTTPDNGFNTYSAIAYNDNGVAEGDAVTATSKWFGDPTQALPYSYNFKTGNKELWNLYTVVDANNDGYSWELDTRSYGYGAVLKINSEEDYSNANDYLVTPPFNFEEGYYKVSYSVSVPKGTKVMLGTVSDINDVAGSFTKQATYTSANGYVETTSAYVHITADTKQYVAWRVADSFAKTDNVYIRQVDIERSEVVPGVVTDLKVTPDPDMALSATVEWKNPAGTNIEGVTTTLTKAIVYRNSEEIATITEGLVPGETMTYVDNDVPNAGTYTYTVEVYNANGKSADDATSVESDWIGAGKDVPYTADFNNWTIYNVNGDTVWGDPLTWVLATSAGAAVSITSNNTKPDDYIISERINFVPKHVYDISFETYNNGYDVPYTWELTSGSSTDYNSHSKIYDVTLTEKAYQYSTKSETLTFRAVEDGDEKGADGFDGTIPAGVRCLGFHAVNKGCIGIKNFTIVENAVSTVESLTKADGYAVVGDKLVLAEAADVVIVDLSGKTVIKAYDTESVDLSGLGNGVYLFRAGKTSGKFVR